MTRVGQREDNVVNKQFQPDQQQERVRERMVPPVLPTAIHQIKLT